MRKMLVLSMLVIITFAIVIVFWQQELKYALPTPVPKAYKAVAVNQFVDIRQIINKEHKTPVHLHFYNPVCPCSKFNTEHFISLTKQYRGKVDFYVIVANEEFYESVGEKFGEGVTILIDKEEKLADSFGVYSTPQAVLVDTTGRLYYRGNYNKSRYCTDMATNYAQIALESILAGKPAPEFNNLATTSYGCELKDNNIFNFSNN